jgi:uncharacterized protein
MHHKHIPQRTCIVCHQVRNKRDLVRVVRTAGAGVVVDPSGKLAGRGAYLCRMRDCWDSALSPKSKVLDHALKATLSDAERAALNTFAQTLPVREERDGANQTSVAAGATV